jgi:hypothetical protein
MGGKSPKPYEPPKPPTPIPDQAATMPAGAGAPTPGDLAAARDGEEERRKKTSTIGTTTRSTSRDPAAYVGDGSISSSAVLTG